MPSQQTSPILLKSIDSIGGFVESKGHDCRTRGKKCNMLIVSGAAAPVGIMLGAGVLGELQGMVQGLGLRGAGSWRSSAFLVVQFGSKSGDAFNILWGLVFGFATLNILSLVTRRYEPNRNRMSPGELVAVATVVVSVLMLGFEMLGLFHVLPLRVPLH